MSNSVELKIFTQEKSLHKKKKNICNFLFGQHQKQIYKNT